MSELSEARFVDKDYEFKFECKNCGDCCRNVKNGVMVEPLDFYRIVNFLKKDPIEIFTELTEVVYLVDCYPVLMLKTKIHMDTCAFLRKGKCSIYEARPRACRMYPLGADPDEKDFASYIPCIFPTRKHHFEGETHKVSDWMDKNNTLEDREFIKYDVKAITELAPLFNNKYEDKISELILLYKYFNYDFSVEFLPQFITNIAILKEQIKRLA